MNNNNNAQLLDLYTTTYPLGTSFTEEILTAQKLVISEDI